MRNWGIEQKVLNIDFMVFMVQELEELLKKIIKVKLLLSLKKPQNTNKQTKDSLSFKFSACCD